MSASAPSVLPSPPREGRQAGRGDYCLVGLYIDRDSLTFLNRRSRERGTRRVLNQPSISTEVIPITARKLCSKRLT